MGVGVGFLGCSCMFAEGEKSIFCVTRVGFPINRWRRFDEGVFVGDSRSTTHTCWLALVGAKILGFVPGAHAHVN